MCICVSVCVAVAVYTVLMLIYPNGQHYQLAGSLLLCSLKSSITPLLQFPRETAGLKLHRSYQHNSLMTIKVPGWEKHTVSVLMSTHRQPLHACTRMKFAHVLCQRCKHCLDAFSPPGNTLSSHTQEKGNQFHAGNCLHTIFWQKL